jgi:hypothetical protein
VDSLQVQKVQGVGLRQSFAGRKARIIPSLSLGYAKLTTSGETTYYLEESGVPDVISYSDEQQTENSGYITFQLRLRLTQLMALTFSGRSVMPDFDTSQLSNNVSYSAGFSWVF